MPDERVPTPRVVLMEFEVPSLALPTPVREALAAQTGTDLDGLPETLTMLTPVARAEGGRIAVIEETARAAGKYRAPGLSGWTARRGIPPSQQRLDFEDADD